MATNKHNRPDITVQTGNFMAPYGYHDNQHREHVTFDDMIPTMFNLEVKYKNIEDYLDAIDSLIQRYLDHKTDPDILSGLKSISNYNFIANDENRTILIKVNQNDHITSEFPISDIFRVYLDTSIYKIMTYDELLERLNQTETRTLQLKDIHINEDDIYNREVNEDMEKNRKQWEEIMNLAEKQRNITDQEDNSDIQIKLDVIEDLLSDIRDNLKDQERKRLYKDNIKDADEKKLKNLATTSGDINNKFNNTSKAISLISWDENQVTALFLGDPSILIKAFFNKKGDIIATVQTDLDKLSKQDLFVQVIDSRGLYASVIIDDKSHVVVEIKSKDIKVSDSLPMIAQMAVLVYQLKTISEEDLIDIDNSMDIFIADHFLAEAGGERL